MPKKKNEIVVHESSRKGTSKRKLSLISVKSPRLKKQLVLKDQPAKTPESVPFRSRMSPAGLYKFLTGPPSPQQVSAIKSLGFGSLLNFNTNIIPGGLPPWLVSTFDVCNCSLLNGNLKIDDIDIHLAVGLPMGDVELIEAPTGSHDEFYLAEKAKWLAQYPSCKDSKVTKAAVLTKMISQVDGGDDFKRNFILYVVSTLLMGVKSDFISARILNSLGDLSMVPSYNWCSFTHRHMIESIDSYQKDPNSTKMYGGPIMVLVFIYLDRVVHKLRNNVTRVFPTMSTWTRQAIQARVSSEAKYGFGRGRLVERLVPVVEDSSDHQDDNVSNPTVVDKLASAAVGFAQSYAHFSSTLTEAKLALPKSPFVLQMNSLAVGVCDGYNESCKSDDASDPFAAFGDITDAELRAIEEIERTFRSPEPSMVVRNLNTVEAASANLMTEPVVNVDFRDSDELLVDILDQAERAYSGRPSEIVDVIIPTTQPDIDVTLKDVTDRIVSSPPKSDSSTVPCDRPEECDQPVVIQNEPEHQVIKNEQSKPNKKQKKDPSSEIDSPVAGLVVDCAKVVVDSAIPMTECDPGTSVTNVPDTVIPTPPKSPPIRSDEPDSSTIHFDQPVVLPNESEHQIIENVVKKTKKKKIKDRSFPSFYLLGPEFDSTQESESQTEDADIRVESATVDVVCGISRTEPTLDVVVQNVVDRILPTTPKSPPIPSDEHCNVLTITDSESQPFGLDSDSEPQVILPVSQSEPTQSEPLPLRMLSPTQSEATLVSKRRVPSVTDVYRSPFMQRNVDLVRPLSKLEKSVVDLALLEGSQLDSEILFQSERHKLTRSDLKTLIDGDRVAVSVLRVWCDILNKSEDHKSSDSPLRLFCYLDTFNPIEDLKINFNDVKLVFLPMNSRSSPSVLFCANFITSRLEVIHAMTPNSVPYDISLKKYKDSMVKLLKGHRQSADTIHFFHVQEFVPKPPIVGNDSGIHMMSFMDTYVGKRTGYTSSLSNANRLKKFSLKVCYRILTSDLNTLKDKVMKDAESGPGRARLANPTPQYSDEHLLYFVRATKSDPKEDICVDTPWMQVTLEAMQSLKQRQWVSSMIIDIVGIRSCLSKTDFLYLPTVVQYVRADKRNTLYTQYVKMTYIPLDGKQIKKVFFPLIKDKHWFAMVCDLEKRKIFILNSAMEKDNSLIDELVLEVIFNVEKAIDKINGYEKLNFMCLSDIEHVHVPQQNNTFDCGVFMLKWLEAGCDDSLWTSKEYYTRLQLYRSKIMLDLFRWEENRIKVFDVVSKRPVRST